MLLVLLCVCAFSPLCPNARVAPLSLAGSRAVLEARSMDLYASLPGKVGEDGKETLFGSARREMGGGARLTRPWC